MAVLPTRICELVETFDRHIEAYRSSQYNETQLRREFIDPFFEELGWDVTNKAGYAQAYKDVIHEDAIKIGSATKAPDYCFRIGGSRKFFLEAKKPSVDIKGDPHPAYQLRRYAWSARLPLSILTDFEEFAVYDCQIRPRHTDRADVSRIMLLTYKDYLKKFPEIADIFSKEAILKGSFDKFAAATKGKRGTSTVDKEFLAEIENWRNMLARIIALRNTALSVREINFCVQRTIDRILFLRMSEDRGIEPYGQLQSISSGDRTYPRLCEVFEKADQKYNSGLFHFHDEPDRAEGPDELTPNIIIDDKDLKWILHSLYYPQSPYEFSVLPAEILGNVYEQFLGKVITLTSGHRASVEDKPEVKKAGGVYYTPSYIVDYIVKNTVGRLLGDVVIPSEAEESVQTGHCEEAEGRRSNLKPLTPRQVSNIKILDPACGSGSFLIGAYQYLLDWHLKYYTENEPEKYMKGKNPKIFEKNSTRPSVEGEESRIPHYGLTITEKKRILLNNIYGVDIDSQAVEVTKLSLLLKVLEGESSETLDNQYRLFHERALPDLANNIKCGNSLIGPDFYDDLDPDSITADFQQKINAFDWQAEFPEIVSGKNPGFDVVIGNPPYVRQETLGQQMKDYLSRHYESYASTSDLYVYFIEKSIKLLNSNGFYSMITSNKWMKTTYGKSLRRFLTTKTNILKIIDFGELPVFKRVGTFPSIILTSPSTSGTKSFFYAPIKELNPSLLLQMVSDIGFEVRPEQTKISSGWPLAPKSHIKLLEKIEKNGISLEKYCGKILKLGIKTGFNKAFIIDSKTREKFLSEEPNSAEIIKPFAIGDDIRKYNIRDKQRFLILTKIGVDINRYPSIFKHLKRFEQQLKQRCDKGNYWWELRACDYYDYFEKPKIIYPDIAKESRVAFDPGGLYLANTIYLIPSDDLYILGLLNSKLIFYYYKHKASVLGDANKGGRLRWFTQDVLRIPIHQLNVSCSSEKVKHNEFVKLVQRMLDLHKKLSDAKIPDDKTRIQRQIDATDKQIDKLVYDLYGLTEEEIKIIEGK